MSAPQYLDNTDISDKLAIATTTFYNPDSEDGRLRADLAGRTIRNATDRGYKIVVVDGGSADEVLRQFEIYGARIFAEAERGMGASRRQAIREAHNTGREVVAWTEPEKDSYIPEIHKTAIPILRGEADLVVPNRGPLTSYPTAQQHAEPLGNAFFNALTGHALDMWSGPRTWRRDISDYFLQYDGEYGDKWDSIFIPVIDAIVDGRKVVSVDVDYVHPKEQTDKEDKDIRFYKKRLEQLENLLGSMETHWKKLHPEK